MRIQAPLQLHPLGFGEGEGTGRVLGNAVPDILDQLDTLGYG